MADIRKRFKDTRHGVFPSYLDEIINLVEAMDKSSGKGTSAAMEATFELMKECHHIITQAAYFKDGKESLDKIKEECRRLYGVDFFDNK